MLSSWLTVPTPHEIHDKGQAGSSCHGIPPEDSQCAGYTLGYGMAPRGTRRGFVGISLSILIGGILPIDDIPVKFRNILEQEHEIEMNLGSDCEVSWHIKAVLGQSPTDPLYTLMLIMRYMDDRVDIDGYPTDDDYSLTDSE